VILRANALRVVLRFAGAVLLVSGLLLIADGVLTLVWREPVTSWLASRAQADLERELPEPHAPVVIGGREHPPSRRRVAVLARAARRRAKVGHAIGSIELPRPDRHYVVVEGTDAASLRKGPGHYAGAPFPGEGGTVAVAGHRTTYLAPFRTIDRLRRGDAIRLVMPYATLEYTVQRLRVVVPSDVSILRRVGHEQLVLTACHPLYSASHRLVAFATLRSVRPPSAAGA
jgi:sortase A